MRHCYHVSVTLAVLTLCVLYDNSASWLRIESCGLFPFEFVGMVHISEALFFFATACNHLCKKCSFIYSLWGIYIRSALLEAASYVALRFVALGGFEVQQVHGRIRVHLYRKPDILPQEHLWIECVPTIPMVSYGIVVFFAESNNLLSLLHFNSAYLDKYERGDWISTFSSKPRQQKSFQELWLPILKSGWKSRAEA